MVWGTWDITPPTPPISIALLEARRDIGLLENQLGMNLFRRLVRDNSWTKCHFLFANSSVVPLLIDLAHEFRKWHQFVDLPWSCNSIELVASNISLISSKLPSIIYEIKLTVETGVLSPTTFVSNYYRWNI